MMGDDFENNDNDEEEENGDPEGEDDSEDDDDHNVFYKASELIVSEISISAAKVGPTTAPICILRRNTSSLTFTTIECHFFCRFFL